MEIQGWIYKEKELKIVPEGMYGFTYLITCTHPDYKGYIYVGKKAFLHASKKKVTKKEIKETKTRKRTIKTTKDSGWLDYYGSSVILKGLVASLGKQYFKREVLAFAISKTDLSLQELEYICKYRVLRIKESFNMWASGRIYKKYLI